MVDALSQAVSKGVSVILLLTKTYDVPGLEPYHNFLRHSAIEKLKVGERQIGRKAVFVYHLEQDQIDEGEVASDLIYVHAKTLIIDDCYAVIGSANISNRSMTTDTELGIAIVDSATDRGLIKGDAQEFCTFARKYRIALWKEHLKINDADIDEIKDPLNDDGSPAGFPRNVNKIGHTCIHQVPEPRFCSPSIIPFLFMNSTTNC